MLKRCVGSRLDQALIGATAKAQRERVRQHEEGEMGDDDIIQTPDGPMRWGDWKKKNPIQTPSRRTKGKDLPNKVKKFTDREG